MVKREYHLASPADLPGVARRLLGDFPGARVFLLSGEMGAGKTTFVQALCAQWGVQDDVVSPTYTLINEYRDAQGLPVYHADLYRLDSVQDVLETGLEDCLFSEGRCLVEWPDLLEGLLPDEFLTLVIARRDDGARTITAIPNA